MEQVEVCNSWEEFDDNSKLLEQQLEKLALEKRGHNTVYSESEPDSPSTLPVTEGPPKMKVLKRTVPNNNAEVTNGVTTASTNGVIDVTQDESLRTQYTPPEPRISILSRPKKKSPDETMASNASKSKNQPVKTLEQREQEYAEARKRIFGDTLET